MNKAGRSGPACPQCGQQGAMQYLPKEIDRQVDYEDITVPAEPEPRRLTVAITRITYRRDYLCPACGHGWSKTYVTESQKHV